VHSSEETKRRVENFFCSGASRFGKRKARWGIWCIIRQSRHLLMDSHWRSGLVREFKSHDLRLDVMTMVSSGLTQHFSCCQV